MRAAKSQKRSATGTRNRQRGHGTLFVIGGHEEKSPASTILKEIAKIARAKIVVTTVASSIAEEVFSEYRTAFKDLGVREVIHLRIEKRADAMSPEIVELLKGARGIFFSGGDQLKATSQIGDTPVFQAMAELYRHGGVVAGTSAGASIMADVMMVDGDGDRSHVIDDAMRLSPGLSLVRDVVIDQHFAQRGRMGRLVGAVAQNPKSLGIGLDENTAAVFENAGQFHVIGSGAVYIFDGKEVTFSNIAEESQGKTMSIYGVTMHVLSQGDAFDMKRREPIRLSKRKMNQLPEKKNG